MMTEKDRELIAEAKELSCSDWFRAFDLAEQADTEEAKEILSNIGRLLYHREEYNAGLL